MRLRSSSFRHSFQTVGFSRRTFSPDFHRNGLPGTRNQHLSPANRAIGCITFDPWRKDKIRRLASGQIFSPFLLITGLRLWNSGPACNMAEQYRNSYSDKGAVFTPSAILRLSDLHLVFLSRSFCLCSAVKEVMRILERWRIEARHKSEVQMRRIPFMKRHIDSPLDMKQIVIATGLIKACEVSRPSCDRLLAKCLYRTIFRAELEYLAADRHILFRLSATARLFSRSDALASSSARRLWRVRNAFHSQVQRIRKSRS